MNRSPFALLTLMLLGCATHVPQVLTPRIVPASFGGQAESAQQIWPKPDWWRNLGSPELTDFIARAQTDNRGLAVAEAQILEAKAQVIVQRSTLFPQVGAQAQAQRANAEQLKGSSPANPTSNSFALNLGATYQLDLWGEARSNLRAAKETLKSARFAQQSVALTLTANVADTYLSLLALRERMSISDEDIAAIKSILDLIALRVATGTISHLELAQEQAQLESVRAQLAGLEQSELNTRVALAILLGQPPETLEVAARTLENIAPPELAPGLPSQLLVRRPDVAAAEARLASAHADLDAARAAFLPQFSLTGNGGYASPTISALLRGPSFVWDAGANLLQTIFDGGKLIGQKELALATQQELVASYQNAVLQAYADVESALGQVKYQQEAEDHLRRAQDAAREAFGIAQLQYRQGTADLLTVLQAQQTLFSVRDQLAQTRLARLQAIVHLYEALGGGWEEQQADRTQVIVKGG
jgi:outer membrane protein, multidrug efflux system